MLSHLARVRKVSNNFRQLTLDNTELYYNRGYLEKGNLVKFRYNESTILKYSLDGNDNAWNFGTISKIMWYVKKPNPLIVDNQGDVYYDIEVNNATYGGTDNLSPESHEIFILKNE